jgi:hypothetical protein
VATLLFLSTYNEKRWGMIVVSHIGLENVCLFAVTNLNSMLSRMCATPKVKRDVVPWWGILAEFILKGSAAEGTSVL